MVKNDLKDDRPSTGGYADRSPEGIADRSGPPETAAAQRIAQAWAVLATVPDPEVPAVSVCDLGIVRDVFALDDGGDDDGGGGLEIVLTPTYSGCPATEAIASDVVTAIDAAGLGPARVSLRRAPAWTSDWISAAGRTKMLAHGIVPPGPARADGGVAMVFIGRGQSAPRLACPRCGSANTERLAAFGSTACKATYRCRACGEPFEHFKAI